MALRLSAKLRDDLMKGIPLAQAMSNCVLKSYTLSQPATAEAAPVGTLLCTYSNASGTLTREVLPLGVVTLSYSGTGTGSIDTFTINSLEIMGTAVSTALATIDLVAAAVVKLINDNPRNQLYTASNVAGVITISGKPGVGALLNTKAIAVGATAGNNSTAATVTSTTFGSGSGGGTAGVYAVNGLNWGTPSGGVLPKHETQVWSGLSVAGGVAGWFRFEAAVADAGGIDSTESIRRIDGAIGVSGAELNMGNTTIIVSRTQTIAEYSLTLPTA